MMKSKLTLPSGPVVVKLLPGASAASVWISRLSVVSLYAVLIVMSYGRCAVIAPPSKVALTCRPTLKWPSTKASTGSGGIVGVGNVCDSLNGMSGPMNLFHVNGAPCV